MSLYDYDRSRRVLGECASFAPLLMALIQVADSDNLARLGEAFPRTVAEVTARFNAPSGVLPTDPNAVDRLAERIDPDVFRPGEAIPDGLDLVEIDGRRQAARDSARNMFAALTGTGGW